jgi:hypothetical protein
VGIGTFWRRAAAKTVSLSLHSICTESGSMVMRAMDRIILISERACHSRICE